MMATIRSDRSRCHHRSPGGDTLRSNLSDRIAQQDIEGSITGVASARRSDRRIVRAVARATTRSRLHDVNRADAAWLTCCDRAHLEFTGSRDDRETMGACRRCGDGCLGSLLRSSLKPRGAVVAPFGFALLTFAAVPGSIGYQDLASLIASRTALGAQAGEPARSSFGTFHAATFSFPRPVGSAIPEPFGYRVASLDIDVGRDSLTGSTAHRALFDLSARPPALDRDTVNRTRKGDRLVPRAVAEWVAREQAARTAATPLAAPEAPAVIAALPDAAGPTAETTPAAMTAPTETAAPAAAAAPTARTGWPVVLPQTKAEVAAIDPAVADTATAATPPAITAEIVVPPLPAEAFSAASMAWLGSAPAPARSARTRRAPAVVATATPSAATLAAAAAPATIAATTIDAVPARIHETEAAPETEPQQSFMLASASTEIVLPRAVTPKADLSGPPAVPAVEAPTVEAPPVGGLPPDGEPSRPDTAVPTLGETGSPALVTANVYFGAAPLAGAGGALQPWSPGAVSIAPDPDAELADLAALDEITPSAATLRAAIDPDGGETIVRKGEVMPGDGRALRSPAERLGLVGAERTKAERCLADAVYFESRGEPLRGQIAVAQVVMNRVFSGYYPGDVCGVVYQNAHRHLSCQFTFACDGIKDKITEPDAWERAQRVATETLDGQHWLPDVGKATHYHAYWVRPWWVRTMNKLDKIGVHTFYRPRKWGDGADRPAWGDASLPPPAEKIADRL
jgi:hypothetical protein